MQLLNRVAVQPERHPETGTRGFGEVYPGKGLSNREGDRRCGEQDGARR